MKNLTERFKELHFTTIEGFRANFKMAPEDEKALEEYYARLK